MCIFYFFTQCNVHLYKLRYADANYCKDSDNLQNSLYVNRNKFRFYTYYPAKSVPNW